MNENTKHLHIEDEETIGKITRCYWEAEITGDALKTFKKCINITRGAIKRISPKLPMVYMPACRSFSKDALFKYNNRPLEITALDGYEDEAPSIKTYSLYIHTKDKEEYTVPQYGICITVDTKTSHYFVTEISDSPCLCKELRSTWLTQFKQPSNQMIHSAAHMSVFEVREYNTAISVKFAEEFLKEIEEVYFNDKSAIAKTGAFCIGDDLNLGDYKERYVYDEPGDLMKALISNIPEVEMLFKAVDYIAANDTSDGNIYETRDKLKDFLYGVMNDHINLRAIKGEQYDFNNPIRWNDQVDKYSGEKGYFEYTQNKSCERESDEQEEEAKN